MGLWYVYPELDFIGGTNMTVTFQSLDRNQIIPWIEKGLSITVSFSTGKWGQRYVELNGEQIKINRLITKFLSASEWDTIPPQWTLEQRMLCWSLWGKLRNLYIEHAKTVHGCKAFKAKVRDFLHGGQEDKNILFGNVGLLFFEPDRTKNLELFGRDLAFSFEPQEFQKIWPTEKKVRAISVNQNERRFVATKELMGQAIAQQHAWQ